MKVSVIIPCHNAEEYLAECLASVSAQSHSDLDILLVDDRSTDNTVRIMEVFCRQDGRMQHLQNLGKGSSDARNTGLDAATGEWVMFVDADDVLPIDAVSTLLDSSQGSDMVIGVHQLFGSVVDQKVYPDASWPGKANEARKHAMIRRLIEGDSVLNIMCNKLHRLSFLREHHLRLCNRVKISEDALFNLEAILCGARTAFVNQVTYRYRMHNRSVMHSERQGEFERHAPWLREMRALLQRYGLLEKYWVDYVNSVLLRFYKDSGVGGVIKRFHDADDMLNPRDLSRRKLTPPGIVTEELIRHGIYPVVYPLIYPFQVIRRKIAEARDRRFEEQVDHEQQS